MCERGKNKKTCKSLLCDPQVHPPPPGAVMPRLSREKKTGFIFSSRFHVDIEQMIIKPRLS